MDSAKKQTVRQYCDAVGRGDAKTYLENENPGWIYNFHPRGFNTNEITYGSVVTSRDEWNLGGPLDLAYLPIRQRLGQDFEQRDCGDRPALLADLNDDLIMPVMCPPQAAAESFQAGDAHCLTVRSC